MVTIDDMDTPYAVANKLIMGKKSGAVPQATEMDMFSVRELRAIGKYLMNFCNEHERINSVRIP